MARYLFWITLLAGLLSGCGSITEEALIGTWKPLWVTEGEDTIQADLSKVVLELRENQKFRYQITATEMMSGTYQLNSNLLKLYNQVPEPDTTIVQVLDLQGDQLVLRMNFEGNERKMKLIR